jgi:hypothetical protein
MYAFLAGLAILLGACDSSTNGGGTPVTKAELVGKWNATSLRYNVTSTVTPANPEYPDWTRDTTVNLTGSGAYRNLKADGTYEGITPDLSFLLFLKGSAEGEGRSEAGTWSVSGNLLTTVSSDGDTAVVAVALNGASATFTQTVDDTDTDGGFTFTDKGAITIKAAKQ